MTDIMSPPMSKKVQKIKMPERSLNSVYQKQNQK